MSLRSPLGQVLGRGSAKSGVSHWWVQRMTALALVPLTLWFAFQLVHLPITDSLAVREWVAAGVNPALLVLFVTAVSWHSSLGIQVVIEDYVHVPALKLGGLLLNTFLHITLAVAALMAVLRIAVTTPSISG